MIALVLFVSERIYLYLITLIMFEVKDTLASLGSSPSRSLSAVILFTAWMSDLRSPGLSLVSLAHFASSLYRAAVVSSASFHAPSCVKASRLMRAACDMIS
jgi:hypothetical protein